MTKVMIIGAYGAMAQLVTQQLLDTTDATLVLYLRRAQRLGQYENNDRVMLVDGDATDTAAMAEAMTDVDVVYSSLGNGVNLDVKTAKVIAAMKRAGQQRLIYISALGAQHEVPGKFGEWNEAMIAGELVGFRKTAALVADSGLTYTEVRPAWLTNRDEVTYEVTQLADGFKGTEVSRQSVADFVVKTIMVPMTHRNESVGLDKPGTDGDKPRWY